MCWTTLSFLTFSFLTKWQGNKSKFPRNKTIFAMDQKRRRDSRCSFQNNSWHILIPDWQKWDKNYIIILNLRRYCQSNRNCFGNQIAARGNWNEWHPFNMLWGLVSYGSLRLFCFFQKVLLVYYSVLWPATFQFRKQWGAESTTMGHFILSELYLGWNFAAESHNLNNTGDSWSYFSICQSFQGWKLTGHNTE